MPDLRDLAEELETLEAVRQECDGCTWDFSDEPERIEHARVTGNCPNCGRSLMDEDDSARLAALRDLQEELFTDTLREYADNEPILIPVYEFEEYCQDFAESCGYVKEDDPLHPYIDWERWANSLRVDYTEVEFDGDTCLIRVF